MEKLSVRPDLLLVDGQGIAHPRRFGLASHLGVLLDIPSIGCAKTRFIGTHDEPDTAAGCYTDLWDKDELIGAVLRTRTDVKPLYISIGHKIDFTDGARPGAGLRRWLSVARADTSGPSSGGVESSNCRRQSPLEVISVLSAGRSRWPQNHRPRAPQSGRSSRRTRWPANPNTRRWQWLQRSSSLTWRAPVQRGG